MAKRAVKQVAAQPAGEAPMVTGTELAQVAAPLPPAQSPFMDKSTWETAMEQAQILVQSGMLPMHIKTPAQFMAIVVRGRELGLAPMESVSHLFLVNGKVSLDVQTQLGIIYRRLPGASVEVVESTAKIARVMASRPGRNPKEYSFSWEEAQTAQLAGKAIWKQYPKIMLLWRAIAQACRTEFPDVLAGVYAPGELPQDTRVIEVEGKVVSSAPATEIPDDAWDRKQAVPPAKVDSGAPLATTVVDGEPVDTGTGEVLGQDAPLDEAPLVRGSDIKPPAAKKQRLF